MKLYFCYENNNVVWPDYLDDFIEASTPVKFVEHVAGSEYGLGTYPSTNRQEVINLGLYVNWKSLVRTELIHLYMKARGLAE